MKRAQGEWKDGLFMALNVGHDDLYLNIDLLYDSKGHGDILVGLT